MPAWIKTPAEEAAWKKAKAIVREQRGKAEDAFEDRDWGLVTNIAKGILKSSFAALALDPRTHVLLAQVERMLETRRLRGKHEKDASLPDDAKVLVKALSGLMAVGGQCIAALRSSKGTGMTEEAVKALAGTLTEATASVTKLLEKVRGGA